MSEPTQTASEYAWIVPALSGAAITAAFGLLAYFARRWHRKRGKTLIFVGDREPPQYITNARWDESGTKLIHPAPRFMNFHIPLTITNKRDIDISIRVKHVWFCENPPEMRKDGWKLPGTSLEATGTRVENAAGAIVDPVTIPANGMVHMRITGTATSPVCHDGPFRAWRYVFVDWLSSPINVEVFIQEIDRHGRGRAYDPDIKPMFPLPAHYPGVQSSE